MSALVETMFYVRETPWHGLGTKVDEAPTSAEAIKLAGLDWNVVCEPIYTADNIEIPNMKANIRDTDRSVLGVVSDRYKIVQNKEREIEKVIVGIQLLESSIQIEITNTMSAIITEAIRMLRLILLAFFIFNTPFKSLHILLLRL